MSRPSKMLIDLWMNQKNVLKMWRAPRLQPKYSINVQLYQEECVNVWPD